MTITGKNAGIKEALDYHLSTLSLSPSRRVAWGNLAFSPIVGEIYLQPFYLPVSNDKAEVGGEVRRHTGLYQVSVYGPIDVTPYTQDEIVDLVIEHFADAVINRNSKHVRIGRTDGQSSLPAPAPELIVDGWRIIPVTVPWYCDTFN